MAETTANHSQLRNRFLRDRLGSILAFFPLGVWTFFHLWDNLAAAFGAEAWQTAVTGYTSPFAFFLVTACVLIPLIWHTIWGITRMITSRPNNGRYNTFPNFKYLLQRISALGVVAFLGAHIWLAFLQPRLFNGHPEPFADIAREMRFHTPTLVVYLLGTLGVSYHLGNGLWGIAFSFGMSDASFGGKLMNWLVIALFILLLGMSWGAIYFLWAQGTPA